METDQQAELDREVEQLLADFPPGETKPHFFDNPVRHSVTPAARFVGIPAPQKFAVTRASCKIQRCC